MNECAKQTLQRTKAATPTSYRAARPTRTAQKSFSEPVSKKIAGGIFHPEGFYYCDDRRSGEKQGRSIFKSVTEREYRKSKRLPAAPWVAKHTKASRSGMIPAKSGFSGKPG